MTNQTNFYLQLETLGVAVRECDTGSTCTTMDVVDISSVAAEEKGGGEGYFTGRVQQ